MSSVVEGPKRMVLWLESEVSPQGHALDTWSPEGRAVLKALEPLEHGDQLEEVGCGSLSLEYIASRLSVSQSASTLGFPLV